MLRDTEGMKTKMNNREEMVYQKLINIRYSNKEFAIFIDQYRRRTFLEVSATGKY